MEISDPCAGILIYSLFPSRSCFRFLLFLLGFTSSLPQLTWEKGFDFITFPTLSKSFTIFGNSKTRNARLGYKLNDSRNFKAEYRWFHSLGFKSN
jgi:hypothetical protein